MPAARPEALWPPTCCRAKVLPVESEHGFALAPGEVPDRITRAVANSAAVGISSRPGSPSGHSSGRGVVARAPATAYGKCSRRCRPTRLRSVQLTAAAPARPAPSLRPPDGVRRMTGSASNGWTRARTTGWWLSTRAQKASLSSSRADRTRWASTLGLLLPPAHVAWCLRSPGDLASLYPNVPAVVTVPKPGRGDHRLRAMGRAAVVIARVAVATAARTRTIPGAGIISHGAHGCCNRGGEPFRCLAIDCPAVGPLRLLRSSISSDKRGVFYPLGARDTGWLRRSLSRVRRLWCWMAGIRLRGNHASPVNFLPQCGRTRSTLDSRPTWRVGGVAKWYMVRVRLG